MNTKNSNRNRIILSIIVIVVTVLVAVIGNGENIWLLIAIILGILGLCAFIYKSIDSVFFLPKRIEKTIEAQKVCRVKNNTLYVEAQNPVFADVLLMQKHLVKSYSKSPEKIHIGAVTVGGVTSGGVYKTGGDVTESTYNVNRFEVIYVENTKTGKRETEIKKIALSDALIKKAQNSPVSEFLQGNEIIIVHDIESSRDQTVRALLTSGHNTEAVNRSNAIQATGYPDREKVTAIGMFLCGN